MTSSRPLRGDPGPPGKAVEAGLPLRGRGHPPAIAKPARLA